MAPKSIAQNSVCQSVTLGPEWAFRHNLRAMFGAPPKSTGKWGPQGDQILDSLCNSNPKLASFSVLNLLWSGTLTQGQPLSCVLLPYRNAIGCGLKTPHEAGAERVLESVLQIRDSFSLSLLLSLPTSRCLARSLPLKYFVSGNSFSHMHISLSDRFVTVSHLLFLPFLIHQILDHKTWRRSTFRLSRPCCFLSCSQM